MDSGAKHPLRTRPDIGHHPDQHDLLQGLRAPQCYPHDAETVECIETHISTVVLAGAYAYKLKKPVDLGFLDFSTLALRRHFCEEELHLNRRLAPGIYLAVVAIVGSVTAPQVVPVDDPRAAGALEFAVKMRRFPQTALLDHMLACGELTPRHVDALAETIARFHGSISRSPGNNYGTPESIELPMRQNFAQLRPLLTEAQERAELDALEGWSIATHGSLTEALARRRRDGFVRECHGDLHLGNIIWLDGEIHVFDGIEFNPGLRWIDTISEIAFTVMDLDARGHSNLAARFLNGYLELTGDYAALRMLPYYLVYRAVVRAKVARFRVGQTTGAARQAALDDYAAHISLAHTYTLPRQPALIITHGVSGSGKSSLSLPLVEQLGALRLRSDVERKRLHGLRRDARTGSAPGAGIYGSAASATTYAELGRLATEILKAGYSVIVDATFLSRAGRDSFRAIAAGLKLPWLILDFRADPAELRRRVVERSARGHDASEATLAVLDRQLQANEPITADEEPDTVIIDTRAETSSDIVARVRQRLARAL